MKNTDSAPRVSISDMDYSTFVGFVRERNRPSGGIRSVHYAAMHSRIGQNSLILEIGSNTGFTSINLALLTGAQVTGVDVQQSSVDEARRSAAKHGLEELVSFQVADATRLPFDDQSFDVVWISNVASFVKDKRKLLSEVNRVLRPRGTLIAVPIFYKTKPPQTLVQDVSKAIGTKVEIMSRSDWNEFFLSNTDYGVMELYHDKEFEYECRATDHIESYCDILMLKPHISAMSDADKDRIRERMYYFMSLFNDNLKYANFSIMLFQKRVEAEEVELYIARAT